MTRKTHASKKIPVTKTLLILLGKPLFLVTLTLVSSLAGLSSLINQSFKNKWFNQLNRLFLYSIPIALVIFGSTLLSQAAQEFISSLPDINTLPTHKNYASTKMYAQDGSLLYKFYDEVNRTPVALSDIPKYLQQATIAKEDKQFYVHSGIAPLAMLRAFYTHLEGDRLTGASTITQQLVKNVFLSSERTVERKLKEMVLALQANEMFSKDQILELYLNRVPYGGTAYGVQEASQMYFGKNVQDLTLAESAFLASRPQSPSSIFSDEIYVLSRKNAVLQKMLDQGFINNNEFVQAQNERLVFKTEKLFTKAPHFILFAGDTLATRLDENFMRNGYLAKTTIDTAIQKIAEEEVEKELAKIKNLHVSNAGVLVLSVKTGEILAMVGSKNYNDPAYDGKVNTTLSLRQPGSSIKIVNYAYALSHGYTPASILEDTPVVYNIKGSPPYKPQNYDGQYRGRITLRRAFAESRNIPAVRLLANYGVQNMVDLGRKMGISSWDDSSRFGLSLTLGGGEVTLLDLAQVYLTIANYGKRIPVTAFQNMTTVYGKTVSVPCVAKTCSAEQVLTPEVAFQIIDILSDNSARSGSFGTNSALVVKNHPEVAVKTGTSNNLRDNLAVGFNQDYLVAVWVGNNDGTQMSRIASGVTGASPIWNGVMNKLLEKKESIAWSVPSQLVQTTVCGRKEWFVKGTEPSGCGQQQTQTIATVR